MFFIYPASIVISLFFALLFIFKRNPRFFDIILSVFFIFRTIDFVYGWSIYDDIQYIYVPLVWVIFISAIAKSILIYIYTGSVTGRFKAIDGNLVNHTIPILVKYAVVLICFVWFRSSPDITIYGFTISTWFGQLFFYISMAFVFFYQVLSLILIRKYRTALSTITSNNQGYKLNWLIFLLITEIIMYISVVVFRIVQVQPFKNTGNYYTILDIIDFGLLIFIGIMAYRQGVVDYYEYEFHEIKQQSDKSVYSNSKSKNSARIKMSETETEDIAMKIDIYMKEKEPFLDHDFTIRKMSNDTNIPVNLLSHFLNSYYNFTFFDFVNKCRVEKVVEKMKEPVSSRFTLISIAYESGFNSKATFNRVFKKHMGQTPSEFYEKLGVE